MFRRLTIFALFALAAAAAAGLVAGGGWVSGEAFGRKFDFDGRAFVFLVLFGSGLLIGLTSLVKDLAALPRRMASARALSREERGLVDLALATARADAGDARGARRHAEDARRLLGDEEPMRRLLLAGAFLGAGDRDTASALYARASEDPGLAAASQRGLFKIAAATGDVPAQAAALAAARARAPAAGWAFEADLDAALGAGAWRRARAIVDEAGEAGLLAPEKRARVAATLGAAEAAGALQAEDEAAAQASLAAALKLDPRSPPAIVIKAALDSVAGDAAKSLRAILAAFETEPAERLLCAYEELIDGEAPARRIERLRHLADKNPSSIAARKALIKADLIGQSYDSAIAATRALLETRARPSDIAFAGLALVAAHGPAAAEAALAYLARADADAALDPSTEEWRRLARAAMGDPGGGAAIEPRLDPATIDRLFSAAETAAAATSSTTDLRGGDAADEAYALLLREADAARSHP